MMGKRLKEIFGLILINITLVSGSLNAETVYADTQAKIEIEKTEMPLKICVDEEINIALIATPTITFFALISFTSFDLLYFYLYFIKYFVSSQSVS